MVKTWRIGELSDHLLIFYTMQHLVTMFSIVGNRQNVTLILGAIEWTNMRVLLDDIFDQNFMVLGQVCDETFHVNQS